MKTSLIKASAIALPLVLGAGNANSDVLELALLLDGSGSISSGDFTLQTTAYQNIFDDDFFTNVITGSPFTSVMVGAWQFATGVQFIGEQLITNDADADAFSALFASVSQMNGATNTGQALLEANDWFTTNGEDGTSFIVDISTDGVPTAGPNAQNAADAVRAAGGVVNAIGVGGVNATFLNDLVGPSGFFVEANDFDEFEATLLAKLEREIQGNPVPTPGTLALLGIGLLGFGAFRKRQAS